MTAEASHRLPEIDRRAAPALALCIIAVAALGVIGCWIAYLWIGESRLAAGF